MKRLAATALTIAAVLVTAGCARAGTPSATPSLSASSASSASSTPSTTPTTTPVPTPPAPAGCPSGRADPDHSAVSGGTARGRADDPRGRTDVGVPVAVALADSQPDTESHTPDVEAAGLAERRVDAVQ